MSCTKEEQLKGMLFLLSPVLQRGSQVALVFSSASLQENSLALRSETLPCLIFLRVVFILSPDASHLTQIVFLFLLVLYSYMTWKNAFNLN